MKMMITKRSDLRRHPKKRRFVKPNSEDVHFIGASAIIFVFSPPTAGSIKRLEGIKKFPINLSKFDFF